MERAWHAEKYLAVGTPLRVLLVEMLLMQFDQRAGGVWILGMSW